MEAFKLVVLDDKDQRLKKLKDAILSNLKENFNCDNFEDILE